MVESGPIQESDWDNIENDSIATTYYRYAILECRVLEVVSNI